MTIHDHRRQAQRSGISRRNFITGVSASVGLWATGVGAGSKLPKPKHTDVDHIVVLMMENRSFDHFLGWLPTADGQQAGLTTPTATASLARRTRSRPTIRGAAIPIP